MLRRIPLGRMLNLRDLGGYPTLDGRTTAWERILRGDVPEGLAEADAAWLLDRGITTVIDLRQDGETAARPDELKFLPGFQYHHRPLMGNHPPSGEGDVGTGYFHMMDEKNAVRDVMRLIAHAPGGVLFHCAAGKDRTGCVAALLLSLSGVGLIDILADYQVSETYIMELLRQTAALVPGMEAWMGRSKRAYMEEALGLLQEKYKSVPQFLLEAGLTGEELDLLRAKLLD